MHDPQNPLEGEILSETEVAPKAHDVTPGWVSRNRVALERVRSVTRAVMIVAPPPARIPLAVASLAADAALLTADIRRRREDVESGGLKGAVLALEGAALLAATRFAPVRLAANVGAIEAARQAAERLIAKRFAT